MLEALERFWTLLATRYRGRNVIFAYDLLNEPQVAWDTQPMCQQWNAWLERKYGTVERLTEIAGANQRLQRPSNGAARLRGLLPRPRWAHDLFAQRRRRCCHVTDPSELPNLVQLSSG